MTFTGETMTNAVRLCVLVVLAVAWSVQAETPPAACGGSEPFRFTLQGSNTDGASWSGGTVQLNARPNQTIYVRLRTLMAVTTGQTEGWSFGVQHTNPWTQYYGAAPVSLSSVTTTGTQTATVQNGSQPDTNHLQIRSGFKGYTQGVVIDNDQVIMLNPVTNFVTSKACLAITPPVSSGTYTIDVKFSHDIGNPRIRTTVTQGGLSKTACAYNLQLVVTVNPYVTPTAGTCGTSGAAMAQGGQEGGKGEEEGKKEEGGVMQAGVTLSCPPNCQPYILKDFKRGDANASGGVDVSDAIFVLNYLFTSGAAPSCLNAADPNDDEQIDISDPLFLLFFLFAGGLAPPDPFNVCGPDRTPLLSEEICAQRGLDCQSYPGAICSQTDSDGDGLTNFFEGRLGTNPNDADDDNDGISDGLEVLVYKTYPTMKDSDGDYFEDGQELCYENVNDCQPGATLNMISIGAHPLKPDIWVEIDWMESGGYSESPPVSALELVVASFNRRGIILHLDTGVAPFNLGNSDNKIPHTTAPVSWSGLNSIYGAKSGHMELIRCKVFHYCLGVNRLTNGRVGTAEIIRWGRNGGKGGDDFAVAISGEDDIAYASVFMHELGHNLGLHHGGFEGGNGLEDKRNLKPNYRSVMSYQSGLGIDTDGDGVPGPGGVPNIPLFYMVDFSDEELAPLNEADLNETVGIDGVHGVDWNNDEDTNDIHYQRDVNCYAWWLLANCFGSNSKEDILEGFNDWAHINFHMGVGDGGGGSEEEIQYIDCGAEGTQ